jgi:hypothetical protein
MIDRVMTVFGCGLAVLLLAGCPTGKDDEPARYESGFQNDLGYPVTVLTTAYGYIDKKLVSGTFGLLPGQRVWIPNTVDDDCILTDNGLFVFKTTSGRTLVANVDYAIPEEPNFNCGTIPFDPNNPEKGSYISLRRPQPGTDSPALDTTTPTVSSVG